MSLKISNNQSESLKEKVKKFIKINQDLNAQNIILRELSISSSQKDEILDLETIKKKYAKKENQVNQNEKEIRPKSTIPEGRKRSKTLNSRKDYNKEKIGKSEQNRRNVKHQALQPNIENNNQTNKIYSKTEIKTNIPAESSNPELNTNNTNK